MIERVIENWLDNVNERGYETAFCQALTAQGHRIIRRPAHGGTEHGKDIVSRDKRGTYHAYQLKTGNLGKSEWRSIRDEVTELVEVPIHEPGVPAAQRFTPHLVANGRITDPVSHEINLRNTQWEHRGYEPLDLILKDDLFRIFVDLQGNFLPTAPQDFETFLRLYLAEKRAFLDKDAFASFLVSFLPIGKKLKKSDLSRLFAGTAILANYVLSGFQRAGNHIAVCEGWILVIAHLLRVAENAAFMTSWRQSLDLVIQSWEAAAMDLAKESTESPNWIEGEVSTDHFVFPYRQVILTGYLATVAIYKRLTTGRLAEEDQILDTINRHRGGTFWGESATPFAFAVMWFLLQRGQEQRVVDIAADLIKLIATLNHHKQPVGLPDPYYDSQAIIKQAAMGQRIFGYHQSFTGRSFSIRPLVEFLVRLGHKRLLRSLWYDITEVDYVEFVPDDSRDIYLWRIAKGMDVRRRWGRPESWVDLLERAEAKSVPTCIMITHYPQLVLPFLLVYPQRLTADLTRFIERRIRQQF